MLNTAFTGACRWSPVRVWWNQTASVICF